METDPKNYALKTPGRVFYAGWIIAVALLLIVTVGLVRARGVLLEEQGTQLDHEIAQGTRVLVAPVGHGEGSRTVQIPATLRGYVETPVYAKIAGYLKSISVDKGDRVRKDQVIAVLVSPELDQQVANAHATYELSRITNQRNITLRHEGVIAAQAADESKAAVLEAEATLKQLTAMQQYKIIRAPFDGIITAREVDPGHLIPEQTAPSSANTPVVTISTLAPLRVYAEMPQSVAPFVRDGDPATITVTEFPQRKFKGAVTRHPPALTSATRTMLVEVDLPNDDGALLPGMYATMTFDVSMPTGTPTVPDDALIFREGKPFVPVVRDGHLRLAAVTLGYDNGINVQVTDGIAANDMVALSVGQSARDGDPVQPITADQLQR